MENDPPPTYKTPPPLILPPPVPKPQKKSRGWMVLALILAALLMLSWFGSVARHLGFGSPAARHYVRGLDEVVIEDNRAANKIAVIEVAGIITSDPWDGSGLSLVDYISKQLKEAGADSDVKAVLLKVNSPGGEVMASDDINQLISDFAEKHHKPVVATMGSLAASGGYYVSVPCDWIVANELTITGSIGVIMPSYNYRKLLDKIGVRPEVYKSGKFKDMLSGSKADNEILPEERVMVQGLIDETFARFKTVVKEGRQRAFTNNQGRELKKNWEDLADGRILTGQQAYENGFVDELGNFDTAVKRAKKLAGITGAKLVRYEQPFSLSSLFRLLGKTEVPAIKLDLGLDLPKLQLGRLYFLSATVLH
jgi:protease-4